MLRYLEYRVDTSFGVKFSLKIIIVENFILFLSPRKVVYSLEFSIWHLVSNWSGEYLAASSSPEGPLSGWRRGQKRKTRKMECAGWYIPPPSIFLSLPHPFSFFLFIRAIVCDSFLPSLFPSSSSLTSFHLLSSFLLLSFVLSLLLFSP